MEIPVSLTAKDYDDGKDFHFRNVRLFPSGRKGLSFNSSEGFDQLSGHMVQGVGNFPVSTSWEMKISGETCSFSGRMKSLNQTGGAEISGLPIGIIALNWCERRRVRKFLVAHLGDAGNRILGVQRFWHEAMVAGAISGIVSGVLSGLVGAWVFMLLTAE